MGEERRAIVRRVDEVVAVDVAAGAATKTQILLGGDDDLPNFAMRRFVMGEGGGMPRHTNSVEHEQYVLRARRGLRRDVAYSQM